MSSFISGNLTSNGELNLSNCMMTGFDNLLSHRKLIFSPKDNQIDGAYSGDNIWLQLGWRPPCEVSKNLVVPVALCVGLWSHVAFSTASLQHVADLLSDSASLPCSAYLK